MNRMIRHSLGAEELLELGQSLPPQTVPIAQPPPSEAAPSRYVSISRQEGDLLVRTVKGIVAFAQDFPLEFALYCPAERWQTTLDRVARGVSSIETQLRDTNAQHVIVPAETIFAAVDLEECVSGARDARLSSAKIAMGISAAAAAAQIFLGWNWFALPAYIVSLAVVLGRPAATRLAKDPPEPFRVGCALGGSSGLHGCPPPEETELEAQQIKLVERVILSARPGFRQHWWGSVLVVPGDTENAVCLKRGRLRIRIEGWADDVVYPAQGWEFAGDCDEPHLNEIGVWELPGAPRPTAWGPVPERSRHEETYWVEYVGPRTEGELRRAGPFGCPFDTKDHALDDGGLRGDPSAAEKYVVFGPDGEPVDVPPDAE